MLEDHAGDIIRKSREAAGISLEAAAQSARLSPGDLKALEASGVTDKTPDFAALGKLLGLNGDCVAAIVHGWEPPAVDLSVWRELRPIATEEDGNRVNCYLVWDEVTHEAALFDTGWKAEPILAITQANQLELKHLFLTHNHEDHVAAVDPIRARFPKVRLHTADKAAPADQRLRANDFIHVGSLRITNRDTPGHSEDGVTYVIGGFPEDAPHVAVVGDAIFAGSMGRGFQSAKLLRQKVKEQVLSLPPETLLCPGHGPLTTVAQEQVHNPFFA